MTTLREERDALRTYVRSFLEKHCPESDARQANESNSSFDGQVWRRMATELGLQGLGISDQLGGSGASWVEVGITFEEMGRVLNAAPYLATAGLGVPTLSLSGDDGAARSWLPRIAAGECIATVAIPDPVSGLGPASPLHVRSERQSCCLSGRVPAVLDGAIADLIIVCGEAADGAEGNALYLIDGEAPGLTRIQLAGIDGTQRFAAIECDDTPAVLLGRPGMAGRVIARVLQHACVAVAAEAVGGARACLEMATSYVGMRTQFGRRIGSFQAVKHRLADLVVAVESATGVAAHAAQVASAEGSDLALVSSLAKSYCCQVYSQAAAENIQLHGGIGFTWEHTAHLHYRRAIALQNLFGSNGYHLDCAAKSLMNTSGVPADVRIASESRS
jgi:alkylation response protein AidB-like acyl-CoA dehydrogenase